MDHLSLNEIISCFPQEWNEAKKEVSLLIKNKQWTQISQIIITAKSQLKNNKNSTLLEASHSSRSFIKTKIKLLLLEKYLNSSLGRNESGRINLSKKNLFLAQKIFFDSKYQRRTISKYLFQVAWKFVSQKNSVIALIQSLGIYCIYSKELITGLAHVIGNRNCLEIGAGDGTLSQLLEQRGASIIAVDDQSWGNKIRYPIWVKNMDAKKAIYEYKPKTIICCWPPPGNEFEKYIFSSDFIELYIMIGSAHRFACGNWEVYESQTSFEWAKDEKLTQYVLPPEQENTVIIFRRKHKTKDPRCCV